MQYAVKRLWQDRNVQENNDRYKMELSIVFAFLNNTNASTLNTFLHVLPYMFVDLIHTRPRERSLCLAYY